MPAFTALGDAAPRATEWGVVAVFAVVYLGMFLGGLPRLKLDRSAWRCCRWPSSGPGSRSPPIEVI